jgi:3-oxoacyl-[acyl-carrier-protein] synthase-3
LPGTDSISLAFEAARRAIESSGIEPSALDQIIVAHNFGNISDSESSIDTLPSLASRIKHRLGIAAGGCVAYDILFGCPGFLQAFIIADALGKAGVAKNCLLIGTETLSRITDPFDRDSMIFGDGAGAFVTSFSETASSEKGLICSVARSYTGEEVDYITMARSNNPAHQPARLYMKMKGRQVYDFALRELPMLMKACLDKAGQPLQSLKKIFIHQTNARMDLAIVQALFQLYDQPVIPQNISPMIIDWLGNNSVATIPTLYDLVLKGQLAPHQLSDGDLVMFASVGAGLNMNAVCYRC